MSSELRLPLIGIYFKPLHSSDFLFPKTVWPEENVCPFVLLWFERPNSEACRYLKSFLRCFSSSAIGETFIFFPLGCESRLMKFCAQEFPVVWCWKVKSGPIRLLETL
jgi:hypothetical protein